MAPSPKLWASACLVLTHWYVEGVWRGRPAASGPFWWSLAAVAPCVYTSMMCMDSACVGAVFKIGLGHYRWHRKNYAEYLHCHSSLCLVSALEFLCLSLLLSGCPRMSAICSCWTVSYAQAWVGAQARGHCDRDLLRNLNIPGNVQAARVSAGSPVTWEQILGNRPA